MVAVSVWYNGENNLFRGSLLLVNDFECEMIGSVERMQMHCVITVCLQQIGRNNNLNGLATIAPDRPENVLRHERLIAGERL